MGSNMGVIGQKVPKRLILDSGGRYLAVAGFKIGQSFWRVVSYTLP